jgi:hypothetical protein
VSFSFNINYKFARFVFIDIARRVYCDCLNVVLLLVPLFYFSNVLSCLISILCLIMFGVVFIIQFYAVLYYILFCNVYYIMRTVVILFCFIVSHCIASYSILLYCIIF